MGREVIVRGEAEVRTMPDRALLRVSVYGEGDSRDDAYRAAAADARSVDDVLDRRLPDAQHVRHGALVVHPKSKWKKGESVTTGWRATRMTTVETRDTEGLGDLFADLVRAGADVSGPDWLLDPQNEAFDRARNEAAVDARARARAYTEALHLNVQGVLWIAEPGLRRTDGADRPVAFAAAARWPSRAAVGDDVVDLAPSEIAVRAAVEVGFELAVAPG